MGECHQPRKQKKGAKLAAAQQEALADEAREANARVDKKAEYVEALLRVLAVKHTKEILASITTLWRSHPVHKVKSAAGKALLEAKVQEGLEAMAEELGQEDVEFGYLSGLAFAALAPATFLDRARPYFTAAACRDEKTRAMADDILKACFGGWEVGMAYGWDTELPALDPGWFEIVAGLLRRKEHEFGAIATLERLDDPRAFDMLLGYFPSIPILYGLLPGALVRAGGKRAIPALLKLMEDPRIVGEDISYRRALESLRELDDPSCVPALKKLAKKAPPSFKEYFDGALQTLQRDRSLD